MKFSEKIDIRSKPEVIFQIYKDVPNWKSWDAGVRNSKWKGKFSKGSTGYLVPPKGPKAEVVLTDLQQNKSFTVESKLPLCRIIFAHELSDVGSATSVVHEVTFTGPLSFFFGRIIGKQIKRLLPATLKRLKMRAEGLSHR